jgi:hypothetical protein
MTDRPFRLRVLDALTEVIKGVSVADGYQHDLGDETVDGDTVQHVFRGRDLFGDNDPLPMVSILEDPRAIDNIQPDRSSSISTEWDLMIQVFARDDVDNPTDPAYLLIADVMKALAVECRKDDDLLGLGSAEPCVFKMKMSAPTVRPPDTEVSDTAWGIFRLTLTLSEDLLNPFA